MPKYLTQGELDTINNSLPANQVAKVGDLLDQALGSNVLMGKKFYLDPVNGSDSYDGLSPEKAFKTLPVAYAALTANKNETLYILGGASALNLSTAFTWAKDYTHLVGLAGGLRFGSRVRIGHNANFSPMFTISGSGCVFNNIHFQTGRGSTTNVVGVSVTGLRNLFSNCHFEAMLNTTEAGGTQAWKAVSLGASAQANSFQRCTFGSWTTVWASANGSLVSFEGDNADTWFDDCAFYINTSSTSMVPAKFQGALSGAQSSVIFNNCKVIATNAAPAVFTNMPNDSGKVFILGCVAGNLTAWAATTANIWVASGPVQAATGGKGVNI